MVSEILQYYIKCDTVSSPFKQVDIRFTIQPAAAVRGGICPRTPAEGERERGAIIFLRHKYTKLL